MAGIYTTDDDGPDECPKCGGTPTLLGTLGRLTWLRCRMCGWQWYLTLPTRAPRDEPVDQTDAHDVASDDD